MLYNNHNETFENYNGWNFINEINPADDLDAMADRYNDIMDAQRECAGTYAFIKLFDDKDNIIIDFQHQTKYPKINDAYDIIEKWTYTKNNPNEITTLNMWKNFFNYACTKSQDEEIINSLRTIDDYVTTHKKWKIELDKFHITPP